jgi:hypothetical protein
MIRTLRAKVLKKLPLFPTYFCILVLGSALVAGVQGFTGGSWIILSQIGHTQVIIYPASVLIGIAVIAFAVANRLGRPARIKD